MGSILTRHPLAALPLWAVFIVLVVCALLAVEVGLQIEKRWLKGPDGKSGFDIGAVAGATLGFLAFMLAIITGIAMNRFDARRALVVEDASAIQTVYLRAGYLDEPDRSEIRALLREYVDVRLDIPDPTKLRAVRDRSEAIHAALWARTEALARANPSQEVTALFVDSVNELINVHTARYTAAATSRIPPSLWWTIYAVMLLTMGLLGMQISDADRRNPIAVLLLALALASVVLLIEDLDRPQQGALRVSQQAMEDVQRLIQADAP
jgi:AcrR family transcriptional regulator